MFGVQSRSCPPRRPSPARSSADRVLQHLLIQLDAHFADMAGLFVAQQVARPADIEIVARQREARAQRVQGLHHRQALLRRHRQPQVRRPGQIGIAALLAAPDPPAQLIELPQPEHVGAVDHQRVHRRHVETALDDVGGQQDVVVAVAEFGHHPFELGRRQPAMRLRHARLGHDLGETFRHPRQVLDARHDAEHLPATEPLALQRLADHHGVERHDEGAHRQPIDRRRRDQAHLPHAGQRELQGARDRRRGQRQHVHIRLELLQPLLVRHTEMLLLVHHQQAEIGELHRLRQQRMRADHDVDRPVRDAAPDFGRLLRASTMRESCATFTGSPAKRSEKVR